jgi:hypothetical protein
MSRFEYKASQVNPVSPGQKVAHSGSLDDKNSQSKKDLDQVTPARFQLKCYVALQGLLPPTSDSYHTN